MLIRVFLLWIILSGGAVWDLKEHRIPNRWLAVGFLALWAGTVWEETGGISVVSPGVDAIVISIQYMGTVVLALMFFFPLFLFRMMGAGDLKLMALIFGGLGFRAGAAVIGFGFLIGAVLAIWKLFRQRSVCRRISYFFAYFKRYFLTNERLAYYDPERDGYAYTLHFALCLWGGMAVYLCL